LRQDFVAQHGREPGPDDRLFPDLPHPEHLEAMMVEDMKAAGLDPAYIYAFEQTGLLVTEQNQHLIPENDLAQWDAAIEEYERKSTAPCRCRPRGVDLAHLEQARRRYTFRRGRTGRRGVRCHSAGIISRSASSGSPADSRSSAWTTSSPRRMRT
jgi:hypothetical protein